MGGEGGDGLPQADEDEIHGGGRPRRHVSRRPSEACRLSQDVMSTDFLFPAANVAVLSSTTTRRLTGSPLATRSS